MRNFTSFYILVLCGVVFFSSCTKEEMSFPSVSGNVDPASIQSSSYQLYLPLEAAALGGIFSKGKGIDSLNVKAIGTGTFGMGARGYAYRGDSLGGQSYIIMPLNLTKTSLFLKKIREFTFSCWLNLPDTTSKQISSIMMVNGGNGIYGTLSLTMDSLYLNGSVYNVNVDSTYTVSIPKSNLKVNDWSHVTFTYDSIASKLSLYVDGKLSKEQVCLTKAPTLVPMNSVTLSQTMSVVYFGAWVQQISGVPTSKMLYYNGKLDEVRMWSKCLTADEVNALSQAEHVLAQIK